MIFPGITTNEIRYSNITLAYFEIWKEALNLETNSYNQDMDITCIEVRLGYSDQALYWGLDEVSVLNSGKRKRLITGFNALLEQTIRSEVIVAKELSERRVPLVLVPYGNGTLWYLGDQCMRQNTGHDSVPYDPPVGIIEFLRYDRKFYQGLKEVNFYDGHNYIIADVDYMTFWYLAHPNPKISCSLVKRVENIWMVEHDLVRLDIVQPHTSSFAASTLVQNYRVEAYDEEVGDMGWFIEMARSIEEYRRLSILVFQVPHSCLPRYSVDELWHQNQGIQYAAYEDSRQYFQHTEELEEQLWRKDKTI
ncbi:hypothetical protein GIB67_015274 [Kingdonia uniflora]|uniref:Uncharacterized protein n=1 Tax=Kingdonia uniflora TaxID=39325 RepID=A0A7J7MTD6_9MAGN|nr:hypothetical protein GIB67_015274 [Kingdonia uniflora]